MTELISNIKDAIDRFDFDTARSLLREALKNPSAEIYYLASQVSLDNEQKIRFLQKSIEADPLFEKSISELTKSTQYKTNELPTSTYINPVVSETPTQLQDDIQKPINLKQEFIIGRVNQNSGTLYRIPYPLSPIRTSLPGNAKLAIIERTESGNWINAFYIGSTNKPIMGWIPIEQIEDVVLGTTQVQIMDLPISNFEYNTRDDIVDLLNILKKEITKLSGLILLTVTLVILALIPLTIYGEDAFILTLVFGFFAFASGSNANNISNEFNETLLHNIGWTGNTNEYIVKLDRLRKSKQDITENQMEFQATMQARQIAGGILTKLTPEFKDLMELTKRNNKNA